MNLKFSTLQQVSLNLHSSIYSSSKCLQLICISRLPKAHREKGNCILPYCIYTARHFLVTFSAHNVLNFFLLHRGWIPSLSAFQSQIYQWLLILGTLSNEVTLNFELSCVNILVNSYLSLKSHLKHNLIILSLTCLGTQMIFPLRLYYSTAVIIKWYCNSSLDFKSLRSKALYL